MESNIAAYHADFLGPYGRAKLQHKHNLKGNISRRLELAKQQGDQHLIGLLKQELRQLGLTDEGETVGQFQL